MAVVKEEAAHEAEEIAEEKAVEQAEHPEQAEQEDK